MKTEHTPGPFHVYPAPQYAEEWEDESKFFTVGPSEFHTAALVRPGNADEGLPEQTLANARLFAAAPDMLAALRAHDRYCEAKEAAFDGPGARLAGDNVERFKQREVASTRKAWLAAKESALAKVYNAAPAGKEAAGE